MSSVKYEWNSSDSLIYKTIRKKAQDYFNSRNVSRNADWILVFKSGLFLLAATTFFILFLNSEFISGALLAYILFLFFTLLLAIVLGHDAAHNCVTGKRNIDSVLYGMTFIMNGIYPGLWSTNHNSRHHVFPNIHGKDSDLTITNLIFLSPVQQKKYFHRYQHLYAPVLYTTFSFCWIFFYDTKHFLELHKGNFKFSSIASFALVKLFYLGITILLPFYFSDFSIAEVLIFFTIAHMVVSVFLSFTFFISHHVFQAEQAFLDEQNKIATSWLRQQIHSTVDFHGQSYIANFIFGGFHAHVAHHLFPNVCHTHYPELTKIIRKELEHTDLKYRSVNFFYAVYSHLVHLKNKGR